MRECIDSSVHERCGARVLRTLDTIERTTRILQSAQDRLTVSARWSGARHTRRNAVACVPRPPLDWRASLVDQVQDQSRRQQLRGSAVEVRPRAHPPAPNPSSLHQQIAVMLVRIAALTERRADEAVRDQLAIADAAARDTRHWLLDEPRHTPESLRDIQASVQAIVKTLDAIEGDHRQA